MTDYGAPVGAEEDTSWIEAIGFFAGWGLPLYLATDVGEVGSKAAGGAPDPAQ